MTDDMLQVLEARGKVFKEVATGHHYKQYSGFMLLQKAWGSTLYKADGRIMVDIATFERMHPDYSEFKNPNGINTLAQLSQNMGYNNNYSAQNTGVMTRIKKEQLFMTWPTGIFNSLRYNLILCSRWFLLLLQTLG